VLFVDHETRLSGGERDLVDLLRAIAELEPAIDLHAALPGDGPLPDALRARGVTVHHVPMAGALRAVSRWELRRRPDRAFTLVGDAAKSIATLHRLARDLRVDVVHSNSMKAHVLSAPAARLARVPSVWHLRDILQAGWLLTAFRTVAWSAARIVCISEATAAPFRGHTIERKVRVVYNGIRPDPSSPESAHETRHRLGAEADDVLVGIVGQIAHWKGQDVFVEAAAAVKRAHPNLRFAVIGECLFPANEGDFDRAIRSRAAAGGLNGRLVWPGSIEPIEPVMAALDLLVHASRLPEPFGRVIVEAMAQGTPVVTTAIGAGPELVPAEAGWVVAPGNADQLAAVLSDVAADPSQLRDRGRAAQETAARFDIAATGRGVLDVWAELG
jgi:glycosyltransferase involved in cell wall biosynthesis